MSGRAGRARYEVPGPFRAKARDTLGYHAERWGLTLDRFIEVYGWDVGWLAHTMYVRFQHEECPDCHEPFRTKHGGRRDLSLDRIDPEGKPYPVNMRLVCYGCNRDKGRLSVEQWGWRLAAKQRSPREDHEQLRLDDLLAA